ncbi:farnesyl pyrophosphate synthase-like [Lutzomyia longipalpis]|uniref:farnesyl pyrophosphate synthase-like n=1 Tax=Lutzomyia longipalpis TaxID=7200 RepID=UPI002483F1A3|nr:farnesyl pyrophosphate synthase-like [Lutzomyia longipalpis]
MISSKMLGFFQISSVGNLSKRFLYEIKHSAGSFGGNRSFKTMSVNYIAEFWDKREYPVLPSDIPQKTLPRNYLIKPKEVTSDMWFSQEKRDEFMSYFPDIVQQLESKAATIDMIEDGKHISEVLNYVVPGGRKYAGVIAAETYKMLLPKSEQTPENIKLGYYLGWCVELLIEKINMADDIMDETVERRNKKAWHLLENVKMAAINDSCIIETGMYYLLQRNFGHLDCFMRLLQHVNDAAFIVFMGQHIDMKYAKDAFNTSLKMYRETANNCAIYIVSYLPVVLGMTLAGYTDREIVQNAKSILTQLGYFYLIENDYMDCFGDPALTGKVGTDIQTGKCRWPIVAFMEKASPEQKYLMRDHYGKDNKESIALVKKLFEDVNMHQLFADYSAELYDTLMKDIEENSYGDLRKVYVKLVETMTCSTEIGGLFP